MVTLTALLLFPFLSLPPLLLLLLLLLPLLLQVMVAYPVSSTIPRAVEIVVAPYVVKKELMYVNSLHMLVVRFKCRVEVVASSTSGTSTPYKEKAALAR